MEKKMYYRIDNGDTSVTCELSGLTSLLEAEATSFNEETNKSDEPTWTIDLVFLTEEEYENLPEAY